ncbi:hypothetical protein JR041_13780 [Pseudomonas mosselii]|nr:hypothetical protein [Pseudomonas mosselii]
MRRKEDDAITGLGCHVYVRWHSRWVPGAPAIGDFAGALSATTDRRAAGMLDSLPTAESVPDIRGNTDKATTSLQ